MNIKKSKTSKHYAVPVLMARAVLKKRGWTQVAAAQELGCHKIHMAKVLTGTRESKSLLRRIAALPPRSMEK